MSNHDAILLLGGLALLLATARLFGELVGRLGLPMVLGEIFAGVLLGPSIVGQVFPAWQAQVFPMAGPSAIALQAISLLSITLFLFVAGLEIDLKLVRQEGKSAAWVGILGIAIPFGAGFAAAYFLPEMFGSMKGQRNLAFAMFFATAMSITALPVIIKTLLDLKIYRTDVGTVIVSAAVFNDLAGWLVFALTLSLFHTGLASHYPTWATLLLTVGFGALVLTVGRKLMHAVLPFLQAHATWPGGVVSFAIVSALAGAAFTQYIGIHGVLGALLVGVALGNSPRLRPHTRSIIERFVLYVLAPIFFAGIGLRVDFVKYFDWKLSLYVFLLASGVKVIACGAGAWFSGMGWRKSLMVGFGMNARGAMEIVLATVALQGGLISESLFVALVTMALVTSALSGPIIKLLLDRKRVVRFTQFLGSRTFTRRLAARTMDDAVMEMAKLAAQGSKLDANKLGKDIIARESLIASGIEGQIAVPHLTIPSLKTPIVAVGISERGIDFKARDGSRAHVLILVLSGKTHQETELEILEDITDTFSRPTAVERSLEANSYTEFLAVVKTSNAEYG